MCYPVVCTHCGNTTWDGCGRHVDSVKRSVPESQWCTCASEADQSRRFGIAFAR